MIAQRTTSSAVVALCHETATRRAATVGAGAKTSVVARAIRRRNDWPMGDAAAVCPAARTGLILQAARRSRPPFLVARREPEQQGRCASTQGSELPGEERLPLQLRPIRPRPGPGLLDDSQRGHAPGL